jgi:alpha-beta hydrolase superfamily lysophospholipase
MSLLKSIRKTPRAEQFEKGYIQDRNNVNIFYRGWSAPGQKIDSDYNGNLGLFIHGMASHSQGYICIADGMVSSESNSSSNIVLYGIDLAGHGNSDGRRKNILRFKSFLENIEDALGFLSNKYPKAKLFLSGESMGALALMLYYFLLSNRNDIKIHKILLWAPAIQPNYDGKFSQDIEYLLRIGANLLFQPNKSRIPVIHEHTFRDEATLHYFNTESRMFRTYSARYLWKIYDAMIRLRRYLQSSKFDSIPRVPLMIIHGGHDTVVSQPASKQFHKDYLKIASDSVKNKSQYLLIHDSWHNIFNDPAFKKENWDTIMKFIKD